MARHDTTQASLMTSIGGMSLFRVCPLDSNEDGLTRMEFDYYNVDAGEKFEVRATIRSSATAVLISF